MTAENYAERTKTRRTTHHQPRPNPGRAGKTIIGQREVIEEILIALFAGGHCLITGAPGLAKTLLVKSIAQIFHLQFQRIQFTPDLMPADITGTEILSRDRARAGSWFSCSGPIFANMILADEINRTPPKTQAALLEAMQEHQVTAAGVRYPLPNRSSFWPRRTRSRWKGPIRCPKRSWIVSCSTWSSIICPRTTKSRSSSKPPRASRRDRADLFTARDVIAFTKSCAECRLPKTWFATRCVWPLRPVRARKSAGFCAEWVSWGAGTRAGQFLVLGAKARALLSGRSHASFEDIRALAQPTLRHRILINYRAEAEGMTIEKMISDLVEKIPAGAKKA